MGRVSEKTGSLARELVWEIWEYGGGVGGVEGKKEDSSGG